MEHNVNTILKFIDEELEKPLKKYEKSEPYKKTFNTNFLNDIIIEENSFFYKLPSSLFKEAIDNGWKVFSFSDFNFEITESKKIVIRSPNK